MIATAVQTLDARDWAVALPLLIVLAGLCVVGLWMILFPDDARRFLDESQKKRDVWFNWQDSRPTPRSFPRVFGSVILVFAVAMSTVLVVVAVSSG